MDEANVSMIASQIRNELCRFDLILAKMSDPPTCWLRYEDVVVFMTEDAMNKFDERLGTTVMGFSTNGARTIFGRPAKRVEGKGIRWWIGIEGGKV